MFPGSGILIAATDTSDGHLHLAAAPTAFAALTLKGFA
jgi:hypothetical protein